MMTKKNTPQIAGSDVFCQNVHCPWFPCHKGADAKTFNCKHCYCPLYAIFPDDCGGTFRIRENGVKDCSDCLIPHQPGGHEYVVGKLREYFSRIRKKGREEGTE